MKKIIIKVEIQIVSKNSLKKTIKNHLMNFMIMLLVAFIQNHFF